MTRDMVDLTSPQVTNWLVNQQNSLPFPGEETGETATSRKEKVWKQSQECPLLANEKNDFGLHCNFIWGWHSRGDHSIIEFPTGRILISLLALETCGHPCVLLKRMYI